MMDKGFIEQARNVDIIDFLHMYRGLTFAIKGNAYRCRQHSSLAVKDDRHSWFWHSKGIGGYGAVDFLMKIEQRAFGESVETITRLNPNSIQPLPETISPRKITLPDTSKNTKRLYAYLSKTRGIDSEIVRKLLNLGKIYQDGRGNVVFVGHDEHGEIRFASLRGTIGNFRMDCAGSNKRYGFNMVAHTPSDHLYIFESPIDAMSHASLANVKTGDKTAWLRHNRLSLAGTSDVALPFFLNQQEYVKNLVFCLDNDPAGRDATAAMAQKYAKKGYQTLIELSRDKDFNEDLLAFLATSDVTNRLKVDG